MEGCKRCGCVRFRRGICITTQMFGSVFLDVWYDFMSVCVRKGGSPYYLRAGPECHR